MTTGIRNTNAYIELLKSFPPRPITSEEEFFATQKVIDSLIDKGELTQDEEDYLNVLGTLVYEYEEQHNTIPDIYGVELLKALIDEFSVQQKDLVPIFETESILSEVLNEERQLTIDHIHKLAEFFHIPPDTFFQS
ncbi:putative transcription regulator containing HTH domain [Cylindrospermum stagnale PCC 7417]|uniref:Putative transcription regulator containing HTH domain n=1 Tax=Cylindrospermum stagnale PCC 7417 TaxID=56107 RepID=K9WUS1_9NOST|nr:transcription regulator containing HTH domain [Cylindrospermum stagnale]AFZ23963.1 putative transcription regulator containing HTH domain [Cylindrospermum stagnale PCC 7417]